MHKAFTIIEQIIYFALATIVIASTLSFAWSIINDKTKQEHLTNLDSQAMLIFNKLSYAVPRADNIDATTVYSNNPGKLILNYSDNPSVTIDTYNKQITLAENVYTIKKLRITENSIAHDLTNDETNVANFTITNLTTSASTIKIDLALNSLNPSGHKTYAASNSWTTSLTLRKK